MRPPVHTIDRAEQQIRKYIEDYQRGHITLYGFVLLLNTYDAKDILYYTAIKQEGHQVSHTMPVRVGR